MTAGLILTGVAVWGHTGNAGLQSNSRDAYSDGHWAYIYTCILYTACIGNTLKSFGELSKQRYRRAAVEVFGV